MSEHESNDIELLRYISTIIQDFERKAAAEEDEWEKSRMEEDIRDLKRIREKWYGRITGKRAQ